MAALRDEKSAKWLDPCVGQGALITELHNAGVSRDRIRGLDLDPSKARADVLARVRRPVDFLSWAAGTSERFERVICNPPFLALSSLDPALRKQANAVTLPDGEAIPLGANYWCAFLGASISVLRKGAAIGFILPAAWDYANYAALLRRVLPTLFGRVEIHRVRRPIFYPVQEGSVILLAADFGGTGRIEVRREHESLTELVRALRGNGASASPGSLLRGGNSKDRNGTVPLDEVMRVGIGAVTGDASYFLMSEIERTARRLPVEAMRPVVTRSRHLTQAIVDKAEWERLRRRGDRVWLFHPPPRLIQHPGVTKYLKLEPALGGCDRTRLKVATRETWYRVPLPDSSDGFMSGMSQMGPWISLSQVPGLTASNTLYVVRFRERLSRDEQAAWAVALMTSGVRDQVEAVSRRYPNGLRKVEPGDLKRLLLPPPKTKRGALARYKQIVGLHLGGESKKSRRMADDWIEGR